MLYINHTTKYHTIIPTRSIVIIATVCFTLPMFESYHQMGASSGYYHRLHFSEPPLPSPPAAEEDDSVFVEMLRHTPPSACSNPPPDLELPLSPLPPTDSLVELSMWSYREESPDSYDRIMSFGYPSSLGEISYLSSTSVTSSNPDITTCLERTLFPPFPRLDSTSSTLASTLYDSTPEEVRLQNKLAALRSTPWPGKENHVCLARDVPVRGTGHVTSGDEGLLETGRLGTRSSKRGPERRGRERRGLGKRLRGLVRRLRM